MPASVTKSPFWNDNTPPLLKNVAFGEISRAHVVAGDVTVTRALFAMNPWEQLPAHGGRLALFPFFT